MEYQYVHEYEYTQPTKRLAYSFAKTKYNHTHTSRVFHFFETHGKAFWSVNTCTCPRVIYVYHFAVSDAELEQFVVQVIEANNRGVSAARNVSNEPNWSFGQSLFFAGTILTTIGKSYEDIMKLFLYNFFIDTCFSRSTEEH